MLRRADRQSPPKAELLAFTRLLASLFCSCSFRHVRAGTSCHSGTLAQPRKHARPNIAHRYHSDTLATASPYTAGAALTARGWIGGPPAPRRATCQPSGGRGFSSCGTHAPEPPRSKRPSLYSRRALRPRSWLHEKTANTPSKVHVLRAVGWAEVYHAGLTQPMFRPRTDGLGLSGLTGFVAANR